MTVFLSRMWANGFGLKRRELYGKLIFLIKNAEKGFTPSVSVSTTKQMYFFNLLKMTCSFFLPLNEVTNYTNPIVYSVAPPLPVRRSTIDFNRALLLTATMYNANFPTAIFLSVTRSTVTMVTSSGLLMNKHTFHVDTKEPEQNKEGGSLPGGRGWRRTQV